MKPMHQMSSSNHPTRLPGNRARQSSEFCELTVRPWWRAALSLLPCYIISMLPQAAQADDGWSFKVAPYVWMARLDGKTSTLAGTPTQDVDLSFRDILENLDFAGFLSAEARHGDLFFVGDVAYASVSDSANLSGGLFSKFKIDSKTFTGTLATGYTLFHDEKFRAAAFGGARIWSIDNDVKLTAGLLPPAKRSHKETFVDPIIGAAVEYDLAPKWTVRGSTSIGGFGAAADFEWGFTTTVSYQAGDNWGAVAGFRFLSVDYDRNGFVYDVNQYGPLVGVYFTL